MNLYQLHSEPQQLLGYKQAQTQVPKLAWDRARTPGQKKQLKHLWLQEPELAYLYAKNVLGKRWPAGEAAIAQDPRHAFWYTVDVLAKRWPKAEAVIATNPLYAYLYAQHVIRGRWPEAEPVIATDPEVRQRYDEYLLRDSEDPS
jgi:hypothetical protein